MLPSVLHALLTGALLLGSFFLLAFCLHIRVPSGPGLPHPVFGPYAPHQQWGRGNVLVKWRRDWLKTFYSQV